MNQTVHSKDKVMHIEMTNLTFAKKSRSVDEQGRQ